MKFLTCLSASYLIGFILQEKHLRQVLLSNYNNLAKSSTVLSYQNQILVKLNW